MNRLHTRQEYMDLIDRVNAIIPGVSISQDMIAGFPTETEEDHQDTLSLMRYVKYDFGFMFAYSERPGTLAARKLEDDIPADVKHRRLVEIINLQQEHSAMRTAQNLNTIVEVLIEKESKKSADQWAGKTSHNVVAVFPKENYKVGDMVMVRVDDCTGATLIGEAVGYSDMEGPVRIQA